MSIPIGTVSFAWTIFRNFQAPCGGNGNAESNDRGWTPVLITRRAQLSMSVQHQHIVLIAPLSIRDSRRWTDAAILADISHAFEKMRHSINKNTAKFTGYKL